MAESKQEECCDNCCHAIDDHKEIFLRCTCALSWFNDRRVHVDNWCHFWTEKKDDDLGQ